MTSDMELDPAPLPRNNVIFGSLNNMAKVNLEVTALWARVLKAVPGSKLILKYKQLDIEYVRKRIYKEFSSFVRSKKRLDLAGVTSQREHLKTYREIDLALDTFPYPGWSTTQEALWMGVPVVSLKPEG